ncbi:MAG: DUF2339 domain-containing protein [Bifidobacteriaceae bacterium]|jgi:hypothetical protein|nr:DUF2339 domain-containing protein [Bifidobacteriaceae bacterium]
MSGIITLLSLITLALLIGALARLGSLEASVADLTARIISLQPAPSRARPVPAPAPVAQPAAPPGPTVQTALAVATAPAPPAVRPHAVPDAARPPDGIGGLREADLTEILAVAPPPPAEPAMAELEPVATQPSPGPLATEPEAVATPTVVATPEAQTPPPNLPPTEPPASPDRQPKASRHSWENLFGRNILGIVASVLVFLGLIFLGVLVVPHLSQAAKITLMFLLSALLTGAGCLLDRRYANYFTHALLGTGLGAFFISIQVSHLYFHALGDMAAFSLLTVWTAMALLAARQAHSLLIGILAHCGMLASVVIGYLTGLDGSRLVLLLVYQLVSTGIIVVGNILCCKVMYRFGLYATLALMGFSSIVMWDRFNTLQPGFGAGLPDGLVATTFLAQFAGGTFLAYLLFVSIIRLKDSDTQIGAQIANLGLWGILVVLDCYWVVVKLVLISQNQQQYLPQPRYYPAVLVGVAVTLAVLLGLAVAMMAVRRKVSFPAALESVTVFCLIMGAVFLLLEHVIAATEFDQASPHLTWLIVLAVFALSTGRWADNQVVAGTGRVLLLLDALFMLLPGLGYSELTHHWTVFASLAYLAGLLVLVTWAWRDLPTALTEPNRDMFRFGRFLAFEASLADILCLAPLNYGAALFALITVLALWGLHCAKQDHPLVVYRLCEFVAALSLAVVLGLRLGTGTSAVLLIVAGFACLALLAERVRLCAAANALALRGGTPDAFPPQVEYGTALAVNSLILGLAAALFDWFGPAYPFSLVCLGAALLIIAAGFWSRTQPLRLYGLVVTIACVLKLVTYDLADRDTAMRVIAFIGGGLICFGISALYNFAVKQFQRPAASAVPATPAAPALPAGSSATPGQAGPSVAAQPAR